MVTTLDNYWVGDPTIPFVSVDPAAALRVASDPDFRILPHITPFGCPLSERKNAKFEAWTLLLQPGPAFKVVEDHVEKRRLIHKAKLERLEAEFRVVKHGPEAPDRDLEIPLHPQDPESKRRRLELVESAEAQLEFVRLVRPGGVCAARAFGPSPARPLVREVSDADTVLEEPSPAAPSQ